MEHTKHAIEPKKANSNSKYNLAAVLTEASASYCLDRRRIEVIHYFMIKNALLCFKTLQK